MVPSDWIRHSIVSVKAASGGDHIRIWQVRWKYDLIKSLIKNTKESKNKVKSKSPLTPATRRNPGTGANGEPRRRAQGFRLLILISIHIDLLARTCGGGVETWERSCNNPRPTSCVGAAKRFATCNPQPCPRGAKDFRSDLRLKMITRCKVKVAIGIYCSLQGGTVCQVQPRAFWAQVLRLDPISESSSQVRT